MLRPRARACFAQELLQMLVSLINGVTEPAGSFSATVLGRFAADSPVLLTSAMLPNTSTQRATVQWYCPGQTASFKLHTTALRQCAQLRLIPRIINNALTVCFSKYVFKPHTAETGKGMFRLIHSFHDGTDTAYEKTVVTYPHGVRLCLVVSDVSGGSWCPCQWASLTPVLASARSRRSSSTAASVPTSWRLRPVE